mmetsp:Transcript_44442/g.69488  ORF Transcript_44442/g.69488 Transcript_44442/m.69488 type:complete len:253 (-) Transcript_44442:862-1620(-)
MKACVLLLASQLLCFLTHSPSAMQFPATPDRSSTLAPTSPSKILRLLDTGSLQLRRGGSEAVGLEGGSEVPRVGRAGGLRGGGAEGSEHQISADELEAYEALGMAPTNNLLEQDFHKSEAPVTIEGDLEFPQDQNFEYLQCVDPSERSQVIVNYYDLAGGQIHASRSSQPNFPEIHGVWQLSILAFSREWTYCAHHGIISLDPAEGVYGTPVHTETLGTSMISAQELRYWTWMSSVLNSSGKVYVAGWGVWI